MHKGPKSIICRGLVLRSQEYGDKDLIFSLLTENTGKLSAIAKSAKATKKFNAGIPDLLDLGDFELGHSKGRLLNVLHFQPKQAFKKIRLNINAFICACCWIEGLEHLTSEAHEDSHELFEIAISILTSLDESQNTKNSLRVLCQGFESALAISGFGSEDSHSQIGFKKLQSLANRIVEISGRQLKSWQAITEIVKSLESNSILPLDG